MEIIPDSNEEKRLPDETPKTDNITPQEQDGNQSTGPNEADKAWAESLGLKIDPPKQIPTPPPYPGNTNPGNNYPGNGMYAPQPVPNQTNITEPMPDSYLLWSILSVIFCCLIPGIVAIVYSAQVSSKYYAKDYEGSKKASERAQLWIIISIVFGVVSAALYLPLSFVG